MFIARALGPSIFVGSFCFSCTWSESWVGLLWNISTSALLACFRFNQLCAIWRENNTNESFVNIALFFNWNAARHLCHRTFSFFFGWAQGCFCFGRKVLTNYISKSPLFLQTFRYDMAIKTFFQLCLILTSDTYLPRIFCVKHTFLWHFLVIYMHSHIFV